MPDNTWFNPYKLTSLKCLSSGPSQGIVYELDDGSVVKVPFQYPVGDGCTVEEQQDHLWLSLNSFECFQRECRIYELLSKHPHPNIVTGFQSSSKPDCIVLERVNPLEESRKNSTKRLRESWILELIGVLSFMEEDLGYLHGDVTISNVGVGHDNRLKIFDFGSAIPKNDDDFEYQLLEDLFNVANCMYFLATGIDVFGEAKSAADVRRIREDLQKGKYPYSDSARMYQEVIEACWSRIRFTSFEQLKKAVDALGAQTAGDLELSANESPSPDLSLLEGLTREEGWLKEEEYRIAWSNNGFEISFI